jgi:hypothetical protein
MEPVEQCASPISLMQRSEERESNLAAVRMPGFHLKPATQHRYSTLASPQFQPVHDGAHFRPFSRDPRELFLPKAMLPDRAAS